MHSLYLVEHKDTECCYVGWTSRSVEERWRQHRAFARRTKSTHFHSALSKYGPDAFRWIVVQVFDSADQAKQAEIYWIRSLKEFGVHLYNLTEGGEGVVGLKHSVETRAKLRVAQAGRNLSQETRAKIRAAMVGRPKSVEHKNKLRGPKSEEHKSKLRTAQLGKVSPMKGRTHSEETRAKMRDSAKRIAAAKRPQRLEG